MSLNSLLIKIFSEVGTVTENSSSVTRFFRHCELVYNNNSGVSPYLMGYVMVINKTVFGWGMTGLVAFMVMSLTILSAHAKPSAPQGKALVKNRVVIELFTSQGCSSCPKADRVFEKMTGRDDVIALSFHVDYWDYLGWTDKMASPVNSKRQRDYARARGDNSVFTPQVIVGGEISLVGQSEKNINKAIAKKSREQGNAIDVSLRENDKSLLIEIGAVAKGQPKGDGTVWLALIKKKQRVKIRRGENRGKTITYHNVVHELSPVGRWMGQKMKIRLPRKHWMQRGSDGCVVFLQMDDDKRRIRGAAQLTNW